MSQMKVARFYAPGGPEQLRIENEPIPTKLKDNELLVKVHAVSLMWQELYWPIYKNEQGEFISHIPGHDYSGTVVKLGSQAHSSGLEVGSEVAVFTARRNHEGGMAEYAIADADQVVPKPKNFDLVETATLPLSALTAWQAVHDRGKLQKGQRVLVSAAASATGMFAVQFARLAGAHVIGTGSTARSREILSELEIDQFVDYKTEDLKAEIGEVDLVLDFVGGESFESILPVVKKDGLVVSIARFDAETVAAQKNIRAEFFIVSMNNTEQLSAIIKLVEAGKVKTFVDKVFPLDNVKEAFQEAAQGHMHGKAVIKIAE